MGTQRFFRIRAGFRKMATAGFIVALLVILYFSSKVWFLAIQLLAGFIIGAILGFTFTVGTVALLFVAMSFYIGWLCLTLLMDVWAEFRQHLRSGNGLAGS